MSDYSDKTVAITGGATGIGFALAKAFGAEGANIIIGEPRENRLDEAVAALTELGVDARSMVMDVTDPDSVEAFADFAWEAHSRVDVLINNAGISIPRAPVTEVSLDQMHAVFDVNFFGVWHGCRSFGKRMVEQGGEAAIYNLASENAFFTAVRNSAAYVASKHAVMGFTEAFREEMPDEITVGTIFPGFVLSEMTGKEAAPFAMDTDRFAGIVLEQIKARENFIVSHAYNIVHIDERRDRLAQAFEKYAPRYEGDDEYDVPTLVAKFRSARKPDENS
ncbi:SDR family oxidoreductase [Parasphingopyxis sp. CP4]|uniref:SDR family NAD(P)-dependent oxidoreductase n=1 Tax=Parasphingopyxis sp. CP4 TaxID=2724527 RepID=UPI0015A2353B|nr:SDR family oxidoreductase [Parasphingopyxis sp. CP4]QLC21829.1 SDR family oxidoreductase [Parasphingopyxis sp. CP4]